MRKIKALGIGLLEMLLVLVVIASILLMAVRYFGQASESVKVDKAVNILRDVTKGSFEWLKGNPDFTNISLDALKGYVTSNCSKGDPCVNDPWGGTVKVRQGPTDQQITIILPKAPIRACNNINDLMQKEGFTAADCKLGYSASYPASS